MMKQAANLPEWLKDEDMDPTDDSPLKPSQSSLPPPPSNPAISSSNQESSSFSNDAKLRMFHWALRIVTMLLCVLMVITSIIGLGECSFYILFGKIDLSLLLKE